MMVLHDRSAIEVYRILTMRAGLMLEIKTGLKRRGRSMYALIKEEFGFKGTKQSVLDQLSLLIVEGNDKLLSHSKRWAALSEEGGGVTPSR